MKGVTVLKGVNIERTIFRVLINVFRVSKARRRGEREEEERRKAPHSRTHTYN